MAALCMRDCCSANVASRLPPDRNFAPVPYADPSRPPFAAEGRWEGKRSRDGVWPAAREQENNYLSTAPLDSPRQQAPWQPPPPPAPSSRPPLQVPVSNNGAFNGRWRDGALVHVIKGSSIYWADGTTTDIEDTGPGSFVTVLFGTSYHGALERGGQVIKWNDGSSWARAPETDKLDGTWRQESEVKPQHHSIRGSTIHWADGGVTDLEEASPGYFSTSLDGRAYHCHLEAGGQRLRWSDGDSWVRVEESGGVSARRSRLALLCIAAAVATNAVMVVSISAQLPNRWHKEPGKDSWPDWQVWQFALGWAAMPFLLVHGLWAAFLAFAGRNLLVSQEEKMAASGLGAASSKPAFLWLLEPMRLIALMHVFWYHEDSFGELGRWGFAWITFFMVLSGFVGSYQIMVHDPDISRTTVLSHVTKRVKRLWPLYLIFLFVMCVPHYFENVLDKGGVLPDRSGFATSALKLCSWTGLLYMLGLQTLIPMDPTFDFVNKTCWFVATLLICEYFLPLWLRGIHALLELAALRFGKRPQRLGRPDPSGMLTASVLLTFIACALTAVCSISIAFCKVYIRTHAGLHAKLESGIFWFLRFSPLGHWPQVLLGAVMAKTFMMMQCRSEDRSVRDQAAFAAVRDESQLSPKSRSILLPSNRLVATDMACASDAPGTCWPWILGAVVSAAAGCLSLHFGARTLSGATVIFMNDGGPAIAFAALILCIAQVSLELPPNQELKRLSQIVGGVCFPAYLFVPHSERLLWHWFIAMGVNGYTSLHVAHWLRIPFIALVQFCCENAGWAVKKALHGESVVASG